MMLCTILAADVGETVSGPGRISVVSFVRKMRKERPLMVRTYKQYVFIYECLLEEFHAGDTMTDVTSIKAKYHDWTRKNTKTGKDHSQAKLHYITFSPESAFYNPPSPSV